MADLVPLGQDGRFANRLRHRVPLTLALDPTPSGNADASHVANATRHANLTLFIMGDQTLFHPHFGNGYAL